MQLPEHFIHTGDEQEFLRGMFSVAGDPIDDSHHLIVKMKRIGKPHEGVSGRFDPHYDAAGGLIRLFEQEFGDKFGDFLGVQVIGVAERAIYIEAEGLYF
jgi:hypothetical protein